MSLLFLNKLVKVGAINGHKGIGRRNRSRNDPAILSRTATLLESGQLTQLQQMSSRDCDAVTFSVNFARSSSKDAGCIFTLILPWEAGLVVGGK